MKTQIIHCSDEETGMTILADGTKATWCGNNEVVGLTPQGELFSFDQGDPREHLPLSLELDRVAEEGADEYLDATPEQELEITALRNRA